MTPFLEMKERAEKAERLCQMFSEELFAAQEELGRDSMISQEVSDAWDKKYCLRSESRVGKIEEALKNLLSFASRYICSHDETHRGGAIWEICDQCGAKWADDEGGKPEFKWPKEIINAQDLLNE